MAAGHSYGEYVALYAAGALDLESLLLVSEARGRFIVEAAAGRDLGTMAAVQAPREEVERVAESYPDLLVANHNSPTQSILSGSRASIESVVQRLQAAGIEATPLAVGAAFHSPFVAPAQARLAEFIGTLPLKTPSFPVYSNTTARPHESAPERIRSALAEHLGSPVEFVAEIEAMYRDGARIFVGVGPKNVQLTLIDQILGERAHRAVRFDDNEGGLKGLLSGLATLLAEGARLNLAPLYESRDCRVVDFANSAATSREPVLSPHMWMLNGSGARRLNDAPRKPLSLDEVNARPAPVGKKAEATAEQSVDVRSKDEESTEKPGVNKENPVSDPMNPSDAGAVAEPEYGSLPVLEGERESVLALYQDVMRQFLKT